MCVCVECEYVWSMWSVTVEQLGLPGASHVPADLGDHPEHRAVHLARLIAHHERLVTCTKQNTVVSTCTNHRRPSGTACHLHQTKHSR